MTEDGKSEREVKIRVALTKDAFNRHEKLITGNIDKKLKKRLIKTINAPSTFFMYRGRYIQDRMVLHI